MVLHVVDDDLLVTLQLYTRSRIVGIFVWHHVEQLHRTVRGSRDGQRDVYRLTIGIRCSGVGRDKLVIDIDRTLDEPIVGRYGTTGFYRS